MHLCKWVVVTAALFTLMGCANLQGKEYAIVEGHEGFNRWSYNVSDRVDKAVLVPVAKAYQRITPEFLARGLANVFANLRVVASSANGFLQGKPAAGAEDFARFMVNSTIGIGGFFDPASRVDLQYQEEDFGQTLAVWGWKRSRYIYVPFLGPSTVRDLPSTFIRGYVPRYLLGSSYHWSMSAVDLIGTRASLLSATEARDASALDPYTFTRDGYVQRRKYLIYDGDLPIDDLFDEFDDLDEDI